MGIEVEGSEKNKGGVEMKSGVVVGFLLFVVASVLLWHPTTTDSTGKVTRGDSLIERFGSKRLKELEKPAPNQRPPTQAEILINKKRTANMKMALVKLRQSISKDAIAVKSTLPVCEFDKPTDISGVEFTIGPPGLYRIFADQRLVVEKNAASANPEKVVIPIKLNCKKIVVSSQSLSMGSLPLVSNLTVWKKKVRKYSFLHGISSANPRLSGAAFF